MRLSGTCAMAAGILVLAGCGEEGSSAEIRSGVMGSVHLGPQCPVETAGDPCGDQPAANVTVTVSRQIPGESYATGEVVARGKTDAGGTFRIAVTPGDYVVTARAGMSCEIMDAQVTDGAYARADIPCDTGIR